MLKSQGFDRVAPCRLVWDQDRERAADKGTVLFYHGLGASKDAQDKELSSLAQRGFLAIGVDNVGHGERRYPDFDWRFSGKNPDFGKELIGAVAATAQETPRLVEALLQAGIIRPDRLGLIGVSMGGYIAYAALLNERRIKAAAVILGSPDWWEGSDDSPNRYLERFYPAAILSQNAGQDTSVSPAHAREFHQQLAPYYAAAPERQQFIEYPDSGHFMLEPDWELCWERSLGWLEAYIQA